MDEGGEEKEEDNNGNFDEDEEQREWEEQELEEGNVGVGLDVRRCDYRVTCRALVLHPTKYRDLFLQKVRILFISFPPLPTTHTYRKKNAKAQHTKLTSSIFLSSS